MLAWLVPISLFWVMAALYLGGMNIRIEGGGGLKQLLGLFVTFALFLVVYGLLRMALGGPLGAVLGGVVLPALLSVLLLPLTARLGFRVAGVRISHGEGFPLTRH